jgi:hypothetical protein
MVYYRKPRHETPLTIEQLNEAVRTLNALRPRPFITDDDITLAMQTGFSPELCAVMRENALPQWCPLWDRAAR